MLKLFLLISSWTEIMGGSEPSLSEKGKPFKSQINIGSNPINYIYNCYFANFTTPSKGGAIYANDNGVNLLIEMTTFTAVKSQKDYGGAIFYLDNNKRAAISKVCASECCCEYSTLSDYSQGQFSKLSVAEVQKHYFCDSSVVNSKSSYPNAHLTLDFNLAKLQFERNNLSNNNIKNTCGFRFLFSLGVQAKFFSFTNSSSTADGGINVRNEDRNPHDFNFDTCNIIMNKLGDFVAKTNGNLIFSKSCILFNEATTFFDSSINVQLNDCSVSTMKNTNNVVSKNSGAPSHLHRFYFKECTYEPAKKVEPEIVKPVCIQHNFNYNKVGIIRALILH